MAVVEIPLTQDQIVLIDDADLELVCPYAWHACWRGRTYYAASMALRGKGYYMHRLITSAQPGQHVDHINGNGLDNRRCNLRLCTNAQNRRNTRKTRGVSRYKGVSLDARQPGRPWIAYIDADGKRFSLGAYATEVEAARTYNAAALELHGEFARLNELEELTDEEAVTAPVRNHKPGRPVACSDRAA